MTKTKEEVCPDCGGEVKYYHAPGITRVVCKNHCKGWKVIREILRGGKKDNDRNIY